MDLPNHTSATPSDSAAAHAPAYPLSLRSAASKAKSLNLAAGLATWLTSALPQRIRSLTARFQVAQAIRQSLQVNQLTSVLRGYELAVVGSTLSLLYEEDGAHQSDLDLVLARGTTHFDELDSLLPVCARVQVS